jgi:hypothetical protein
MKFKLIIENDTFEVEKGDKNESVVTIPSIYKGKKVSRIGSYAFNKAKVLEKVFIPEGVTSIDNRAFFQCKNLTHVELPESLETIEDLAFFDCEKLKSITVPKHLKTIGESSFYGTSISNIKLPNSLLKIGSSAFANCEQLNAITIPEKVTILEEELFYGCINLKTVTLHKGIKKIKKGCFEQCESLEIKSNFLPTSINELPDDIFSGCKKIKILDLPNSIKSIGKNAFNECESLEKINIPLNVKMIPERCFWSCESLQTIFLHDGITSIQKEAFLNCGFKEIKLPKLIEVIEEGTFHLCGDLEKVILPPNLIKINEQAFYMTKIQHIQFPPTLEVIEKDAFSLVFDIKFPFLPNDFIKIHKEAFSATVNIPDEIDPTYKSSTKKSISIIKPGKKPRIESKEETINDDMPICMWCEQEVPHVAWHDDADPDEPICDECYQNFLYEKDYEKKTEEFSQLTNGSKTKDIVDITQIIPYEMSTRDAAIYYISILEDYSLWIMACKLHKRDTFVSDYALPKSFFAEVFNEIKVNNISQIVLPKRILDFPDTKQFAEVHFSKKNSFKPLYDMKKSPKAQKILLPMQDYKNLLKNHSNLSVYGKDENLLYYPKHFYFINSSGSDQRAPKFLPYMDTDIKISELYLEDNGVSININSIAGLFSFQGFKDYRETNKIKDVYSVYVVEDYDNGFFYKNFIYNAMKRKKLEKGIKKLGLIQIESKSMDDAQFFIVSLEDCKNLQSILHKVNKKVIVSL